jgi:hypothetical protein
MISYYFQGSSVWCSFNVDVNKVQKYNLYRQITAHYSQMALKLAFCSPCRRYTFTETFRRSVAYRGEGFGGFKPLPKFRSFDKAEPNSLFRGKYIRNCLVFLFPHPN